MISLRIGKSTNNFDFSKLEIYISREQNFGRNSYVEIFSLSYDGKEFEFQENYGANSEEMCLMTSDGKVKDFEILEEEYEKLPLHKKMYWQL